MKLVGFDALMKAHIALVRGWRNWNRLPYATISAVTRGEFQLEQLRIPSRASPADWIIHNIRLDNDPASIFAGEVSGVDLNAPGARLVMRAGRRFDIDVEYVGPLAEGAVFEAVLAGTRLLEGPDLPRPMGMTRGLRLMGRRPVGTRPVRDQLPISSERPIRGRARRGPRLLVMLGDDQWLFYGDKEEIRLVRLADATALEREIAEEWVTDEGRIRDEGPCIFDEPVVASMHMHRDEEREVLCAMDDRHGKWLFSVGREGASFATSYAWPSCDPPTWFEAR